jgi:hypothetical protein
MTVTASIEAVFCSIALSSQRPVYPAAQNEQWCLEAKSVSSSGCGGTSDSTSLLSSNDGQGTAAVDGSPLAAKFAQAARMLLASFSWSGSSGPWNGACGWSKRYGISDPCVATGGTRNLAARFGVPADPVSSVESLRVLHRRQVGGRAGPPRVFAH